MGGTTVSQKAFDTLTDSLTLLIPAGGDSDATTTRDDARRGTPRMPNVPTYLIRQPTAPLEKFPKISGLLVSLFAIYSVFDPVSL